MTINSEHIQALKAAAEKAGADEWQAKVISGDGYVIRKGSFRKEYGWKTYQPIAEFDDKKVRDFVAAANPSAILSLLAERDADKALIAELTEALKQSVAGYKSCLRMGYDRIIDLGGECDAPEVMIAGNPDIQQAEKILAAGITLVVGE